MFKNSNLSDSEGFSKSNIKFLKIISIILAILIFLCIVFLIFGVVMNFKKLSSNSTVNNDKLENKVNINLYFPKKAQLISSSLGEQNRVLLRFFLDTKNYLLIIDTKENKIIKQIHLVDGDKWEIQ